jgi:hypothetical protein
MEIKIKVVRAVGSAHGKWQVVNLVDLLRYHLPRLSSFVSHFQQFPPLTVLNEELLSGGADLGMSGGCFWKPFSLSEEDYETLKETMLSDPELDLQIDATLADKPTLKAWCDAILARHERQRKGRLFQER